MAVTVLIHRDSVTVRCKPAPKYDRDVLNSRRFDGDVSEVANAGSNYVVSSESPLAQGPKYTMSQMLRLMSPAMPDLNERCLVRVTGSAQMSVT